jgi:agmatine deiminase
MKMKSIVISFIATLLFLTGSAQTMLPRFSTAQEQEQVSKGLIERLPVNGIETPPYSPVRTMAEWEELQALHVAWSYYNDNDIRDILIEIIREAREECNVVILVASGQVANAQSALTNAGVDISSNVSFVQGPVNSIWCRDYGGNSAYTNDVDSLIIVDWIYNRNRPQDNASPEIIAEYLNVPIYTTTAPPYDLVNTGGNFMSDGLGNAFCSELVIEENGPNNEYGYSNQNEAEIDEIMQLFMGINRYTKMETLPYDDIHHIDMHMKLLDEETLLVGQYPEGIADGPQIEANLQYVLNNFTNAFGKPYKVIRIPMPPHNGGYPNGSFNSPDYRTYTNAVFVNKKVLLPLYQQQYDTTALRIWEESLPGYEIVGINCNDIIPYLGAIHCITKEIGVNDPLWITHDQLENVEIAMPDGYPVFAKIKHKSGIASAKIHYSLEPGANYTALDMSIADVQNDIWTVNIPEQATGSTVYYYISAVANSGKSINRPLPAPAAYWKFDVNYNQVGVVDLQNNVALLQAFPNPAKAITCIPVLTKAATSGIIELSDVQGQSVLKIYEGQIPSGESRYFFNAAKMTPGTYFITVRTRNEKMTQKITIY